jgi:hydrogenase maturation protease
VRVIGVGSPSGDDQVGWQVIAVLDRFARFTGAAHDRIGAIALDRPGVNLIPHLAGAERVLLIDAVRSGSPPGSIHRIGSAAIETPTPALSSHGFGVALALALAREIGALPADLVVYGIEIGSAQPGSRLSAVVASAAQAVARLILGELSASVRIATNPKRSPRRSLQPCARR